LLTQVAKRVSYVENDDDRPLIGSRGKRRKVIDEDDEGDDGFGANEPDQDDSKCWSMLIVLLSAYDVCDGSGE
jgi:hypothetical protein